MFNICALVIIIDDHSNTFCHISAQREAGIQRFCATIPKLPVKMALEFEGETGGSGTLIVVEIVDFSTEECSEGNHLKLISKAQKKHISR